jgi:Mrp family chromosome partitioning ATPase
MQAFPEPTLEPTLSGAAWRYRWLLLLWVGFAVAGAVSYLLLRPVTYVATASLVVEDPRPPSLGTLRVPQSPERYLADQVAILESPTVAEQAAEIANERLGSGVLTADEVLRGSEITPSPAANLILVSFRAPDPQVSRLGADALAQAYEEVKRSDIQNASAAALARIDATLDRVDQDVASLQERIAALASGEQASTELNRQFEEAVQRMVELEDLRTQTEDSDELEDIREELDDLGQQLSLLAQVRGLQTQRPELVTLVAEQEAAIARRSELAGRRNQLEVDMELARSGVVLLSPAHSVNVDRGGNGRVLAIAVLLGGLVGTAFAYSRALRRRNFTNRAEPGLVLNAPLLAEIPHFSEESITSELPVRTAPRSTAAEAFRFTAAALDIQAVPAGLKSLVWVSARVGDGKTTLLANTALAAAGEGSRVLAVDADFGAQALTRMLYGDATPDVGMTDVVEAAVPLRVALKLIPVAEGVRLSLLSRGRQRVAAPDFFRSPSARQLLAEVRDQFDLVLVDAPPLLQVAYASSLVALGDAVVVVVGHSSAVSDLEEVADRLGFLGSSVLGYVYNRAPLRAEMRLSEGSMRDVLGMEPEALKTRRGRRKARV